jgi:hypothetical protein
MAAGEEVRLNGILIAQIRDCDSSNKALIAVVLYVIFEINIIRMRTICLPGLLAWRLCNTMWPGCKVVSRHLIGF